MPDDAPDGLVDGPHGLLRVPRAAREARQVLLVDELALEAHPGVLREEGRGEQ